MRSVKLSRPTKMIRDRLAMVFLACVLLACNTKPSEAQDSPPAEVRIDDQEETEVFDLAYIQGHFEPASHPSFVIIDSIYADRPGLYLRKDVYEAFLRMYNAARADGIQLQIRSATRNFDYQKGIWERKWTGKTLIENGKDASVVYPDPADRALAILRFSSMPGTSRHHWGTDIDLNAFENSWFESGEGLRIYEWLSANAGTFGFCQPYTPKGSDRPAGYEEEKWHWSYTPVANKLTRLASAELKDTMIQGFQGASAAPEIQVVKNYVLGINNACLSQD